MSHDTIQKQMLAEVGDPELFAAAHDHAREYMSGIRHRNVFPTEAALARLAEFDTPLPEAPVAVGEILRQLHEVGSPATVASTGGRYFGFVTGGALPAAIAARWLADAWDQVAALRVLSPVTSQIESVCERWLVELLGLPPETVAGFVSGTSGATMCGLAAGRLHLLKELGWDVNARGVFGAPPLRVVMTEQAHATVLKALHLLGFGRDAIELAPTDRQGRMIPSRMPVLDRRCLVIAQSGNVNSGSFDPLDEIAPRVRHAGAWLHVDGAFGLWAAASPATRALTRGLEGADSWSVDAHKTLNAPYDCGVVLCRHRDALVSSLQANDAYIIYGERRDGMMFTPEMSRRARAIDLWATLRSLGRAGVEELVDRLCAHARRFADALGGAGFRVRNDVVFNQVLVACERDELTRETMLGVQRSGECWVGGSSWEGEPVIRISVCSWATTEADVDRSVAAFLHAREQAERALAAVAR